MRALAIFAAAPIPGRIKPRLSLDAGPSAAAEVYAQTARHLVAGVAGASHRTTVWFTPPGEAAFIREWLEGVGRLEYRPQPAGSLGERYAQVFARHFADGARRTVIVGTDAPGPDRRLVADAFRALGTGADLVVGPTLSGGCYLVGLRVPLPALIRGVTWGSEASLAQVRARAARGGLRLCLLRPLRELETLQDAQALGLLSGGSTIDDT